MSNTFIPNAETAAYARGFKDGWDAALKSLDKTYIPGTTKTMDIQWPRDKEAWPTPVVTNVCSVCNMNTSNLTHYVCPQVNCPSRAVWLTYSYKTGI